MEQTIREVTITIPNVDELSDDELATLARFRDGRWSCQTKQLLAQFRTAKLGLNRGWASTRADWTCPCCQRQKRQIARLTAGGVLICRLEVHHDHLGDAAKQIFDEAVPLTGDRQKNVQRFRARDSIISLVERFENAYICIDCNLAEGQAKLNLSQSIPRDFTFSFSEIRTFIDVQENRVHKVDLAKALKAWTAAKAQFHDRLDFARRMAQRAANGRHQREVILGESVPELFVFERDIILSRFTEALGAGHRLRISDLIDARSISNDTAGHSAKERRATKSVAPTDEEFSRLDEQMQAKRTWREAGPSWTCPCCDRSKREICRKSNRNNWTAGINRFSVFIDEADIDSLTRRQQSARSSRIIGSEQAVLICHDCRNVVAELQRRASGFTECSLTVDDIRTLVGQPAPNGSHIVDFDQAITIALANRELEDAIEDYNCHKSISLQFDLELVKLTTLPTITRDKAAQILGCEYSKEHGVSLEDGDAQIEWYLSEARRFGEQYKQRQ